MSYEPLLSPELRSYVDQLQPSHREFLAEVKHRGDGLNIWTMGAACRLNRATPAIPKSAIIEIIEAYGRGDHKPGEIERAVRRSHPDSPALSSSPDSPAPSNPGSRSPWPEKTLDAIEAIATGSPGITGLKEQSSLPGDSLDAEAAVDLLFPGDPLLCVGTTLRFCETRRRSEWRGFLNDQQFIVPSPMSSLTGKTQDGFVSNRALSNTGPRRYMVVEFDFREKNPDRSDAPDAAWIRALGKRGISIPDLNAALHLHLSNYWPLAMVVHSGNKSAHGWYPCKGRPETELREFMRYAVSLGADKATWQRHQWVRLPSGLRRPTHARQSILYINPSALNSND